ncbi:MAG: hypothetical protein HYU36_23055 [Planctomycetes bacterium]|nr:hypothetical protein [Planctomycetota bacterium]
MMIQHFMDFRSEARQRFGEARKGIAYVPRVSALSFVAKRVSASATF